MMNKLKYKITFVALGLILSPLAIAIGKTTGGIEGKTIPEQIKIRDLMISVTNWGFGLLMVLAAVFIFYAAFLYLTAGALPDNVEKAKNFILYAVIALVIGFVARGLVDIVYDLLKTGA